MGTGLGMKASWLVELMLAGVGQRGANDLKWHWFETIYSIIREQPWPWNWKVTKDLTLAPISSTETYTWTAGNDYLQGSGALTYDWNSTGRYLEIDNLAYRVVRVDRVLNRLYLDAKVATTQSTGTIVTLSRGNFTVKTTNIEQVDVDGTRVDSTTQKFWRRFGGRQHVTLEGSIPREYEVMEEFDIPAPLYAPYANGAPGAGGAANGTYEYFWCTRDTESGRHSKPGPSIQITYTGGNGIQSIGYNNPLATNILEKTSYELVLFRSKISPEGQRFAAWKVGSKIPYDATNFVLDNLTDGALIQNDRYYDGPQVDIRWHLWPDAVYSVYVRHINNYGGRADPDDMIPLGKNNIVTELLPMGASTYIELANRGIQEQQVAIIKFRRQLEYLVRKTDKANSADPGLEEMRPNDGIPNEDAFDIYDPTKSYTFKY